MSQLLPICALGVLLCLAGVSCREASSGPPERIVLIVVDTLRRDHLGAFGGRTPTPHIDALAARGQVFANVRAAFHQTTMSMAALFTGRTPSLETGSDARPLRWNGETWCGMARFARADEAPTCLPRSLPTLGERMREAGYWTIGIPSNQFLYGAAGFRRGFDDWVEIGGARPPAELPRSQRPTHIAGRSAAPVLAAVDRALARRREDRFFLYVHFMDVHDFHFRRIPYADAVAETDGFVGHLLARLEAEDLLKDATVVFTADHGERLGEVHDPRGLPGHNGNPAFEEVLEIPLIVAPRTGPEVGPVRRTQDVHALLERLAGLRPGPSPDLADTELYLSEREFRTFVEGPWKTTLRRSDDRLFLYDLEADPGETRSVAEARPEIVDRHRRRIESLTRELAVPDLELDRPISLEERRILESLGYVE